MIGQCYVRGNDLQYDVDDRHWQDPEQPCEYVMWLKVETVLTKGVLLPHLYLCLSSVTRGTSAKRSCVTWGFQPLSLRQKSLLAHLEASNGKVNDSVLLCSVVTCSPVDTGSAVQLPLNKFNTFSVCVCVWVWCRKCPHSVEKSKRWIRHPGGCPPQVGPQKHLYRYPVPSALNTWNMYVYILCVFINVCLCRIFSHSGCSSSFEGCWNRSNRW